MTTGQLGVALLFLLVCSVLSMTWFYWVTENDLANGPD